jgi:Rne/Rng family ribonuclease
MSKEICISSTPHETRLAILEDEQLTEVYYERENEYTLAGSIYKGRVTRVLPGMQSAFVDLGLERDAFLYVTDFMEEQEDSSDFEHLPASGAEPRPARAAAEEEPKRNGAPANAAPAPAPDGEFEEGTRRWRGRRGRRRGFRPPQGGGQQGTQEAAPPVRTEVPPPAVEPIAEPEEVRPSIPVSTAPVFSLPGESLSKYGGQPAGRTAAPPLENRAPQPKTNLVTTKPSTLIETPLEWSGDGLLPGESISRYRNPAAAPVSVHEADPVLPEETAAVSSHEAELPHEEATHEAQTHEVQTHESQAHEPQTDEAQTNEAAAYEEEEMASGLDAPEEIALEQETIEHNHDSPEVQEILVVEEVEVQVILADEPVAAEFEPEEASASYRVDTAAPIEFRVTSPVPDLAEEETEHVPEPEAGKGLEPPAFVTPNTDLAELDTEFDDLQDDLEEGGPETGLVEEEEVTDEEEYDFTPLYVESEDHDLQDLEEETLDREVAAGSEIGDLVRDTHLEQRIDSDASSVLIEEEEDEEEDLESSEAIEEGESEETESEEGQVAAVAGQPARRPRDDQRRGGRGQRHDRRRHNGRRQNAQTSDLPIISELLKQGQEILVQIAKEPIAKKGARITSHIALPGRFLVFMPTVNHVGVSRKISSDEERQRLKRILISEKGTVSGGFIVRTAADGAGEEDLRADIRFLISLWTEIKQRSDTAKAPALIYHDLNLVERILRDQVSDNFSTIWVDTETEYERIVRFLNRFQPSLVRRVKLYTKETPLFEQFGIQDEISKALKSKVWLKSGGSIVINQTEALVAIDINTGKYVGKTARLEDTILKTNLDAIPEIVRQIRLRDLGGIIVIDFIDMDERKNRNKVMQALEEELKSDRAPSKVLQFNDFGLVAITRKRVKQSLERTLSTQCAICSGTGMVKSPTTVCNEIYIEMRKMQAHLERQDVLLRVHPDVVKTLKVGNARWLNELEEMSGKTIIVKSDPTLHPEQFDIH